MAHKYYDCVRECIDPINEVIDGLGLSSAYGVSALILGLVSLLLL